ncbi:hypothetical protein P154DRAFT_571256 [Amniculicola lignicola CBS 123094]|uniref:IDI-2 n=1 Tax=Amniculicola lignicola CBS 123094 TaxID=1392246 RepID=A0A6A5WT56_9PLEO|nr:hypothetical protein P154DRAFT_571256 [Amniculicola lignicola CBS 123094]
MKLSSVFTIFAGIALASATAAPQPEVTQNDCSNLGGEFDVSLLPEGVTAHRKCASHPLGPRDISSNVHKRDCARNPYGCENGYCWKKCSSSDGPWCWQAWDFGHGDWVTCSKDSDCEPPKLGRADCGICNDASCGCSC